MPPPSSTPSSKKREWSSTITRSGSASMPLNFQEASSSAASPSQHQLPNTEFSFQSNMGFPSSTSTASMASLSSMPSSSSTSSFASFHHHQTPMTASPSSFRTATAADESAVSARSTIFSRGNRSASAALRESSHALNIPDIPENPPRKRRRGLAGAIVDTALNAALYTGAAALTAYSLWSSWGHSADNEDQRHHPSDGPQADMGHVISPNKRSEASNGMKALPGTLEEPPPPYYEHHAATSTHQQAFTPQSNAARQRKVFVSSRRNGRRSEYAGPRTQKQSPSRKAMPHTSGSPAPSSSFFSPRLDLAAPNSTGTRTTFGNTGGISDHSAEEDEEEDENDEMLSRFEAKMAALIAEGQAALNSTPVLQDSDLRDIDTPSPSLGIGMSTPRSNAPPLSSRPSQRFDSPFATASPFSHQQTLDASPSLIRSNSHPNQLLSENANVSFLPEPVKRTFATPTTQGAQGLRHSRSVFDFNSHGPAEQSPFAPGRSDSPSGNSSPSLRAAGRRVTDFGGVAHTNGASSPAGASSQLSRIPRHVPRKSMVEPRP
ncbi:hypothetical protein PSEUBRA_002804 [Kalmanozyma brasiliensis GHG001]|uniref:uncharacterized protein n=1 Tax=Kalmanozyma brasiliensis (strain GHG001) TaxID=1365824 RepID=UPI00286816E7|nr:uncharacterized protein PSEUBRA_002804 [Kalmanozyma brasiliensis GHG001]KAF6767134.1 hypothetical protein PSEUBRA_002804 [Kalmanozyma brasiliensis GHG001]